MKSYSVGLFTHLKGVYGVEASDLQLAPGEVPRQIGITHRSGVVSEFVFADFGRSSDGDVTQFNYNSSRGTEKLAVFND